MANALPLPPPGFDDLSPEDKIRYVGSLWDRIVSDQDGLPISDAQRALVRERLAAHQANRSGSAVVRGSTRNRSRLGQIRQTLSRPQPELTPAAHADVLQAAQHYNAQAPLLGFEFLDEFEEFEFTLAPPVQLEAFQVGYAIDPDGNTLLATRDGDWRENWIVFARDFWEDPVFVDIDLPNMPVFTAPHGEGIWSPWQIAPSLTAFANVLRGAQALASNRESPVALESNPIVDHEREAFQALVEANGVSQDYWLAMFQDLGTDP